jgi:hypothetical protein
MDAPPTSQPQASHANPQINASHITMNISRVVPTTAENRPVNRAVRYLIKAKR